MGDVAIRQPHLGRDSIALLGRIVASRDQAVSQDDMEPFLLVRLLRCGYVRRTESGGAAFIATPTGVERWRLESLRARRRQDQSARREIIRGRIHVMAERLDFDRMPAPPTPGNLPGYRERQLPPGQPHAVRTRALPPPRTEDATRTAPEDALRLILGAQQRARRDSEVPLPETGDVPNGDNPPVVPITRLPPRHTAAPDAADNTDLPAIMVTEVIDERQGPSAAGEDPASSGDDAESNGGWGRAVAVATVAAVMLLATDPLHRAMSPGVEAGSRSPSTQVPPLQIGSAAHAPGSRVASPPVAAVAETRNVLDQARTGGARAGASTAPQPPAHNKTDVARAFIPATARSASLAPVRQQPRDAGGDVAGRGSGPQPNSIRWFADRSPEPNPTLAGQVANVAVSSVLAKPAASAKPSANVPAPASGHAKPPVPAPALSAAAQAAASQRQSDPVAGPAAITPATQASPPTPSHAIEATPRVAAVAAAAVELTATPKSRAPVAAGLPLLSASQVTPSVAVDAPPPRVTPVAAAVMPAADQTVAQTPDAAASARNLSPPATPASLRAVGDSDGRETGMAVSQGTQPVADTASATAVPLARTVTEAAAATAPPLPRTVADAASATAVPLARTVTEAAVATPAPAEHLWHPTAKFGASTRVVAHPRSEAATGDHMVERLNALSLDAAMHGRAFIPPGVPRPPARQAERK